MKTCHAWIGRVNKPDYEKTGVEYERLVWIEMSTHQFTETLSNCETNKDVRGCHQFTDLLTEPLSIDQRVWIWMHIYINNT